MRRTKGFVKDKNHYIVRTYVQNVMKNKYNGIPITIMDTSELGGLFLDWILIIGSLSIYIEVKTGDKYDRKNHNLRPGEFEFITKTHAPVWIVASYLHLDIMMHTYGPIAQFLWENAPCFNENKETKYIDRSVELLLQSEQNIKIEGIK